MQNNVKSNISWYEGHTISGLGKILKISNFYVQNIWQVVRRWHHQLTHLHIHIDWSRNVLWKLAKFQSVITSLFVNQFSSGFHCFVQILFTLSSEIKLNLFWSSPLNRRHTTPQKNPNKTNKQKTNKQKKKVVGWEPERLYCCSTMFLWEADRHRCHRLCTAIAPFWFSMEHL